MPQVSLFYFSCLLPAGLSSLFFSFFFSLCVYDMCEGILVYSTKVLASAALSEKDDSSAEGAAVPLHAQVELGGRPSCMAVSRDNERVAVALGDKVGFDCLLRRGGGGGRYLSHEKRATD